MAAAGEVHVKITADTSELDRQMKRYARAFACVGDDRVLRHAERILEREQANAPRWLRPLYWLGRRACRNLIADGFHGPPFEGVANL